MKAFVCSLSALAALLTSPLHAANWPAWRGPDGDGVTPETQIPLTWNATENVRWKVALPERGNSTPIVWGTRVFLTQAVGKRRTLMCLDRADGKTLWQQGPEWAEAERTHGTNPFCAASPVTDGERVIAWFGSAGLWCFDLAGKEQWHLDLGVQDHEWGYGGSPVLEGDLCILNFGPGPRSFLIAVDKKTGKKAWQFDVPEPTPLEGPGASQKWIGSWSTPVVFDTGARRELVATLPGALFGFDPATGKELWRCTGMNPLCYTNALFGDGIFVGLGGFGGWAIGVRAGGSGDVTATHRLWQSKQAPQRIGSGVFVGGRVIMPSDPGVIECLDPKTGEILWKERVQPAGGHATSSWSSLVRSGDRFYLLTQASDTVVFRAGEKYEQLAVNALDDGMCNSSLAVSDGELFIRTHAHLWCIAEKK